MCNTSRQMRSCCRPPPRACCSRYLYMYVLCFAHIGLKVGLTGGRHVSGGTVRQLVVHATSPTTDSAFLKVFLATYRSFVDPLELLRMVFVRYKGPANVDPSAWITVKSAVLS